MTDIDLTSGRAAGPRRRHRSAAALAISLFAGFHDAQALTRKKFDFVVGVDGDFKAAMAAAAKSASATDRFYIFFPDGEYDIGSLTGDANQMTTFPTANVSLIGQSEDKTLVFNKSATEGISISATLYFYRADNLYMQDMSIKNKAVYGDTAKYNVTGRHVAIMERSSKMIYKNVRLLSTQDTYYTKGTRTYWENGQIHGTTDFICGQGDVYFNKVLIWVMKKSHITAADNTTDWGYVFNECTIDGTLTNFDLGRSWGNAKTVYLNTTMNKLPVETGWGDPMNSVPKLFAEYKSKDAAGKPIDLGKRRTSYTKDATTVTLQPVLTDAEAAKYTVANVLTGTDNWQPQVATQQVAAPVLTRDGNVLKWNDDPKALCWAVFKNGKFLASVATNSYTATGLSGSDVVTVRAANEMGGLGPSSGSSSSVRSSPIADLHHEILDGGRTISVHGQDLSSLSASLHKLDGSRVEAMDVAISPDGTSARLSIPASETGIRILRYGTSRSRWSGSVLLGRLANSFPQGASK